MAGRPKMKARRVSALAGRAEKLHGDLLEVLPIAYGGDRHDVDPVDRAWWEATEATREAAERLAELARMLREKAGVWEPTPVAPAVRQAT